MSKLIDLIRSNKFEQAKQLLKDENEIVTESELSSIISFGSRHDDRRANCQELVPLVCARLLKNNQPLSEQYITDVIKVFDSKSVEVIVDVVVKTGGKVTEKTLIQELDQWADSKYFTLLLQANNQTNEGLSTALLEKAINRHKYSYIKAICQTLIQRKISVPEELIKLAISRLARSSSSWGVDDESKDKEVIEAINAVIGAVSANDKLTENILTKDSIESKTIWESPRYHAVIEKFISEISESELTVRLLEKAIIQRNHSCVQQIANQLIKRQTPLDEKCLTLLVKNFHRFGRINFEDREGKEVVDAFTAVKTAVLQTSGKITEATVIELIEQGKGEYLAYVLDVVDDISSSSLNKAIEKNDLQSVKAVCEAIIARNNNSSVSISEEYIEKLVKKIKSEQDKITYRNSSADLDEVKVQASIRAVIDVVAKTNKITEKTLFLRELVYFREYGLVQFLLDKMVEASLKTKAPLAETLIVSMIGKGISFHHRDLSYAIKAVKKTGGKVTQAIVIDMLSSSQGEQFCVSEVVAEIEELTVESLKTAINNKKLKAIQVICKELQERKVSLPEDLIELTITKFTERDRFTGKFNVKQAEETVLIVMSAVVAHGEVTGKTLALAIGSDYDLREALFSPTLDAVIKTSKTPIPERLIVSTARAYSSQTIAKVMAVINAVSKTGSEITEDTLLELITIYAHGNKDFHKTILPVIADKIKLISIKSLHKAIECKNIFCIEFVCQTLIERGVPVDQGLVASTFVKFTEYSFGYDASNTEYAISVVINAVRKTNQKISEEILLNQSCSKIWEDDKYQALFKIILTAIVDTKGAVSVALLEKTIRKYNPNPVYVKQICDELISRKISVTEGHIIQAINAIYFITPSHDKAIKAVINAVVSSGNPITESTLNRVMNGGPRLQYVIDGMKATPGSLSTEPLRAMLENNEKYSEKNIRTLCQVYANRKTAVTEEFIILAVNKFSTSKNAAISIVSAIINTVVRTSNPITESTLMAVMSHGGFLRPVLMGMQHTEGTLSTKPLEQMINSKGKYTLENLEDLCDVYIQRNIAVPEEFIAMTMAYFNSDKESDLKEAVNVVINAVIKTNQKITEVTLMAWSELTPSRKFNLIEPIFAAIKHTRGVSTLLPLEMAIGLSNIEYVKDFCDFSIQHQIPVPESLIVDTIWHFNGAKEKRDIEAVTAVINAVIATGQKVSDKTLNTLLDKGLLTSKGMLLQLYPNAKAGMKLKRTFECEKAVLTVKDEFLPRIIAAIEVTQGAFSIVTLRKLIKAVQHDEDAQEKFFFAYLKLGNKIINNDWLLFALQNFKEAKSERIISIIIEAIKAEGLISSTSLQIAIEQGSLKGIKDICKVLMDRKIPVPESFILKTMQNFSHKQPQEFFEATTAVMNAVLKTGHGITEVTLNAILNKEMLTSKDKFLLLNLDAVKDAPKSQPVAELKKSLEIATQRTSSMLKIVKDELLLPIFIAIQETQGTFSMVTFDKLLNEMGQDKAAKRKVFDAYFKCGGEMTEEIDYLARQHGLENIAGIARLHRYSAAQEEFDANNSYFHKKFFGWYEEDNHEGLSKKTKQQFLLDTTHDESDASQEGYESNNNNMG